MDAKDKKKKLSGVAKMVKTFLKRESKPKLSFSKKTARSLKPVNPKPSAAKKSHTRLDGAKHVAAGIAVETNKPIVMKKNGRPLVRHSMVAPTLARVPYGAGPRYFFNTDIPDQYNETYMRAIPRDPQWLFVYWEITESTRKRMRGELGESAFGSAKRILRLIDITDISYDGSNAQRYNDIEINEFANNWYVRAPESGRTYVLELGLLTTTGKFNCAVRSNAVTIPRMGVSPLQDEEWATVSTDELIRMSADAMHPGIGSSERRFAAAETLVGHAGLFGSVASGSGSGGFSDFSSGSRY